MNTAEIVILIVAIAAIGLAVYMSLTARRLDRLNRLVVKSRRALEHALTARAQYAHDFANCGALDIAGGILLADAADCCLRASMRPIVNDGLDVIQGLGSGVSLEQPKNPDDDRRTLESHLSRTLRLTFDQLTPSELAEDAAPLADKLNRARLDVRLTRSFHNSHVAQVHQVRRAPLVSMLHLFGRAPEPSTVDMDDE